jgi:hypothetical protein
LVALVLSGGIYLKIKWGVEADVRADAAEDTLERVNDAVRAGDAVPTDPKRLRDPDRHCRDC